VSLADERRAVSEKLQSLVASAVPAAQAEIRPDGELAVRVPAGDVTAAARALASAEPHPLAYLSCVSGVDWPSDNEFEVVWTAHSLPGPAKASLRVRVDRNAAEPTVPSLSSVWPTADFLRRILLRDDFPGHPLRKDFEDERPARERVTKEDYTSSAAAPEFMDRPSDLGEHEFIVNMGPQHPSTHGVLRVILRVDGEEIVDARPDVGFLHRCFEKVVEGCDYKQVVPFTDRLDYVSSLTNELAYVVAVEKLAGIEVPERAQWLRVLVAELQRIASHLVWFGTFALDLGATTPFLYAIRERELILDMFEALTGARLTYSYMRIGGVRGDLPPGFGAKAREFLKLMPSRLSEYENLIMKNRIFVNRLKGVGRVSAEQAVAYGASGPTLRGSGVDFDLRRDEPYAAYDRFEFGVPLGSPDGDVYDRAVCRFAEMYESLKIVEQALEGLPEGNVQAKVPRVLKPPAGEVYSRIESPRGEVGVYIVSDGSAKPHRVKWRAPSFVHLQLLPLMGRGHLLADMVAVIGSIDIILGEVDR